MLKLHADSHLLRRLLVLPTLLALCSMTCQHCTGKLAGLHAFMHPPPGCHCHSGVPQLCSDSQGSTWIGFSTAVQASRRTPCCARTCVATPDAGAMATLPKFCKAESKIDTGLHVSCCAGGLATPSASSRMPSSGTLRRTHVSPSKILTTSTLWCPQRQ